MTQRISTFRINFENKCEKYVYNNYGRAITEITDQTHDVDSMFV